MGTTLAGLKYDFEIGDTITCTGGEVGVVTNILERTAILETPDGRRHVVGLDDMKIVHIGDQFYNNEDGTIILTNLKTGKEFIFDDRVEASRFIGRSDAYLHHAKTRGQIKNAEWSWLI